MHIWGTSKSGIRKLTVITGEKAKVMCILFRVTGWASTRERPEDCPFSWAPSFDWVLAPSGLWAASSQHRGPYRRQFLGKFLALRCPVWEQTSSCLIPWGMWFKDSPRI